MWISRGPAGGHEPLRHRGAGAITVLAAAEHAVAARADCYMRSHSRSGGEGRGGSRRAGDQNLKAIARRCSAGWTILFSGGLDRPRHQGLIAKSVKPGRDSPDQRRRPFGGIAAAVAGTTSMP